LLHAKNCDILQDTRKSYIIYRRGQGDARVYHIGFWDEDHGSYRVRRSADKLIRELGERARHLSPTRKAEVDAAARMALEQGIIRWGSETLVDYLASFWAPGSLYLERQVAQEKTLSVAYVHNSYHCIRQYVLPWLKEQGKENLSLVRVTTELLEALLAHLRHSGLGASRVNSIRKAIGVALGEAERLGLLPANPVRRIQPLPDRPPRREILSLEEVRVFFAQSCPDRRYLAANLLAATTGMRLGEIRGLQIEDLRPGYIHVCHNWQNAEGLKLPKWGSVRDVPLPARTEAMLQELSATNPWRNAFIFWGYRRDRPVSATMITRTYRTVLAASGIPETERCRRHLTFHAWRHWYNSMMRGKVEDHVLRLLTGHATEAMTEHYTELPAETIRRVGELAEGLIILGASEAG
jgi:integrase